MDATSPVMRKFLNHAGRRPRDAFLRTSNGSWSWQTVAERSDAVRARLVDLGARPGLGVALALDRSVEFVFAYCGAKLLGAIPIIIDPTDAAVAARILERVAPAVVVTAGAEGRSPSPGLASLGLEVVDDRLELHATTVQPGRPSPKTLPAAACHVLYTSGSTTEPKGIVWSENRFIENTSRWTYEDPEAQCCGLLTSPSYAMGTFILGQCLWWGMALAVIDSPHAVVRAFEAIDELGVTRIGCTPTHVELIMGAPIRLPSALRAVNVTGAPIAADRLLAFADRLAGIAVTKSYGLAEVGAVAGLSPEQLRHKPGTVGLSFPGRNVRICDPAGDPVPPGTAGEIVVEVTVHDPCDGYFLPSPELAGRFRDGVLRSGDRGYVDGDGFLVLTERAAEVLKIGGRSVSARHIEAELGSALGCSEIAVVGVPHDRYGQVAVAFYVPSGDGATEDDLRQRARLVLRVDEVPRWFLPRWSLPRTASGKLRRAALEREAARWAACWDTRVAHDDTLWPARTLEGALFMIDGMPWSRRERAPRPGSHACAREVAFVVGGRPPRLVARARLSAGVDAATAAVRVVEGPHVLDVSAHPGIEDTIVRALLHVCPRLPGPPVVGLAACSDQAPVRTALEVHGFAVTDGPAVLEDLVRTVARRDYGGAR